jgi:hypothetical protein
VFETNSDVSPQSAGGVVHSNCLSPHSQQIVFIMQPKLVDTHRWTISRKGKNYDVEVKISFPSKSNPDSMKKSGKYQYSLFYAGEFVRLWERDTREPFLLVRATAEAEFDDYLLTDL